MRSLIVFFISLIVIFLAISLLALLLPSKVTVAKSVLINAPTEIIHDQISQFKNWPKWFPPMQDKSVRLVTRNDKTILLKDSSGRQIILKMIKSDRDTINVAFESVSASKIDYQFVINSYSADSAKVTLIANTILQWYPWQKLKGIFLYKITGPMYEEMLENLKKATAARLPSAGVEGVDPLP